MLILSCNLDSLLFLSKNDIMFIKCSNSIACSNRVKQRWITQYYTITICCFMLELLVLD